MSDLNLAYGVEFAITPSDLVLLEKGPKRIPMDHISRIQVIIHQTPKVSMLAVTLGVLAFFLLFVGWMIPVLLVGSLSVFFFVRGPSKRQICRAYAWTNALSDEDVSFHVANDELDMLKRAMSSFPKVTLQTGAE